MQLCTSDGNFYLIEITVMLTGMSSCNSEIYSENHVNIGKQLDEISKNHELTIQDIEYSVASNQERFECNIASHS